MKKEVLRLYRATNHEPAEAAHRLNIPNACSVPFAACSAAEVRALIISRSCWANVDRQLVWIIDHNSALFGESLVLRIPWSVKLRKHDIGTGYKDQAMEIEKRRSRETEEETAEEVAVSILPWLHTRQP